MKTEHLTQMLKYPQSPLDDAGIHALGEGLEQYPYFQPLHYIKALKVFQTSRKRSRRFISRLAVYTGDREVINRNFFLKPPEEKSAEIEVKPAISKNEKTETPQIKPRRNEKPKTVQSVEEVNPPEPVKSVEPEPKSSLRSAGSFTDWLNKYSKSNEQEAAKPSEIRISPGREEINKHISKTEKSALENTIEGAVNVANHEILDRFIRNRPRIGKLKKEIYSAENMARQSVMEDEELVSETLARINFKQGNYARAIRMYEKLKLIYPDKMAYFAKEIERVKEEKNKK